MSFWDKITSGIKNHLDKQKQDREQMDNLRREAEAQRRIIFEEEFKKDSLEVAKRKAKQDAAKLSGLQKLRAINRARRLTESGQGENLLSKLSSYTQKNIAKREENLKRTEELREAAMKMRGEKIKMRKGIPPNRKPFGNYHG